LFKEGTKLLVLGGGDHFAKKSKKFRRLWQKRVLKKIGKFFVRPVYRGRLKKKFGRRKSVVLAFNKTGGKDKIKLPKKVLRMHLPLLFLKNNSIYRAKFLGTRFFFSSILNYFSSTFINSSRKKGSSLISLSNLLLDWKFLVKSNFERLLYRLYYYYRLSFYNYVFSRGGVQTSRAKPLSSDIMIKRFFFLLKKAVERRTERTFFDRLFLEISEMLFFFESTYSVRRNRYVQDAVATRMSIHFYTRKKRWK
jgi:hypothetical protein